jgi:hypothetical protein
MAYNPFDDVIEQDPAYMSNGGGTETTDQKPNLLKSSLKPIQKVGEFFEPGLMYMGEAMANAPYQFGKLFDTDKTTKERYQESIQDPKSFIQGVKSLYIPIEAAAEGLTYIFNPQDIKDVRVKLPTGEATPIERIGAQVGSTFELLGAGELFGKIGARFGQQVADSLQKQNLTNINTINALPVSGKEKVEFAKELYQEQSTKGTGQAFVESGIPLETYLGSTIKNKSQDFMALADILNKTSLEDINKPLKQIIEENNLTKLLKTDITPGRKEGKKIVAQPFIKDAFRRYNLVPEDKLNKIDEVTATQTYKDSGKPQQIKEFMEKSQSDNRQFNAATEIAAELGITKGNFENIISRNPELKELRDQIVIPKGENTQNKFKKDFYNLFADQQKFVDQYKNMENEGGQQIISEINALKRQAGIGNEVSTFKLFQDYAYDKYRSIKETKGNEKLNAKTFMEKYMDDSDLDNFKEYAKLELDRNKANALSRTALEELYQNPAYKPYLQNAKGDLDVTLLQYDKAHDIPMFVTRKEGQGRLQTKGRFTGAGVDVELIQPNLQYYNNLQRRLDPYLNYFADVLNNKTLENSFKNKPVSIGKNKKANLNNPINKRLLDTLSEYGYNPDISKFDNQYDFIKEVTQFIDTTYKDRKIRSIVPIREKGNIKSNTIFGIEEPNLLDPLQQVRGNVERLKELLDYNIANNISPENARVKIQNPKKGDSKSVGYLKGFKKGGAVRKAIGGTLENINQQNFTPDPAIEGDSAFQQAVKDENLVAFNPTKIFKFFKDKIPGVYTPSKTDVPPPARDPNTNQANLPAVEGLQDYDFPLKSFTVDKIQNSNTKAAKPQDWINELQGGNASPSAELQDSGLFQYMADFERYYPNSRMTKEQLINFYEQSPIANIQVKVKSKPTETPYGMPDQEFMGRPQHENAGSAPLDDVGTNYREIVISAGKLPGEDTPFIASSHFNDPNVLVFSRVADYKNAGGDNVTVIQELQTDLLTNVRKEQERLAAEILNQKKKLQINQDRLQRATETNDIYTKNQAQQNIDSIQKTLPQIEKLAETGLIKPYPLTVAKELIPTFEKQMMDFQSEMQDLMRAGINRTDPEYLMKIDELQKKQFAVFEELRNLNRTSKFDDLTDGVQVPQSADTENLQLYAQNQSTYESVKDVTTFPPIPFNKQADYVDLILKATIKDAENRNINKIAIMPAEVGANKRWSKTGDAKKKFENLYDKVGVQQLKNIAKKYGGELNVEQIQDTSKGTFGVKYFNKGVDGEDVFGETDGLDIRDAESYAAYFDSRAMQEIANYGDGKVMVRREIAPGQFSEFILKSDNPDTSKGYKLVDPTGDEAVIRVMEEYNPSLVNMMVLTLPKAEAATKSGPMFMFRKKEGGIIPEDRLVSITDIYGDY